MGKFIVCKLFPNKAILKKKTGISGKQQPTMVDFHLTILFQSESIWSFLLFSTLRLFQSCHGLFTDQWAEGRSLPWGRGQVCSFWRNSWVLQVPDSWRLALSCLLNDERVSERKQENWKLRMETLTFPSHPLNFLISFSMGMPGQDSTQIKQRDYGLGKANRLCARSLPSLPSWMGNSHLAQSFRGIPLNNMNLRRDLVLLPRGLD